MTAAANCTGSTATLTVTGGVPGYQYSIDSGTTYTATTLSSSYTFTGIPGSIIPAVKDSRGIVVYAPEINCSVSATFVLLSVDDVGTGNINSPSGSTSTSSFNVTQSYGSYLYLTGSPTSGSTYLGWTQYSTNVESNEYLTTGSIYGHQFIMNNDVIYAAVKKDNVTTYKFCYYSGSTPTGSICTTCNQTASVYFNLSQYSGSGFASSSWFVSSSLTGSTPDGLYKLTSTNGVSVDSQIYSLTNGTASYYGACSSGSIYCV